MKAADVLSELLEFRPELTESERPRRPWEDQRMLPVCPRE